MSYLDKPMNRESYFEHIRSMSKSHQTQTRIALDWFEKFNLGKFVKSTDIVLKDSLDQKYKDPQKHSTNLYNLLQDFIQYLDSQGHDPSTVRGNFNLVKNYLNWYGFEIYSESVKSRLKFTKKVEEESYPLTSDDIKKILDNSSESRKSLYLFLTSTGCRISEALQLRKRDLELDSYPRIMVNIAGKYTKTRKPRKTFVTKESQSYLMPILDKIKDDDLIFGTHDDHLKSKHNEEDHFYRMRKKAGLIDKYENGIHKITLHSFRSWFVTKCNRVDSDFGNCLAGHQKYMKQYNRFEVSDLCDLFIKAEKSLSIFEKIDEDQERRITELEHILEEMKVKEAQYKSENIDEIIAKQIKAQIKNGDGLLIKQLDEENDRLRAKLKEIGVSHEV